MSKKYNVKYKMCVGGWEVGRRWVPDTVETKHLSQAGPEKLVSPLEQHHP